MLLWSEGSKRKESTNLDLSSQSNKCKQIHFQIPRTNWTPILQQRQEFSGLVLNLITRKDRVCLTGLLTHCARYSFSVSFELSALGSSNTSKTLHIVCSNLWTRKSGFIWFSFFLSFFMRGSRLKCLFFCFYYFIFTCV